MTTTKKKAQPAARVGPLLLNQLQYERDEARERITALQNSSAIAFASEARLRAALEDANDDACDAQCYFQPDGSTLHTTRCNAAQAALAASPPETLAALRELMKDVAALAQSGMHDPNESWARAWVKRLAWLVRPR